MLYKARAYSNSVLNEEIYKRAKTMLEHRNGSNREDLCILDAQTGNLISLKSNTRTDFEVFYGKKLLKLISNSPENSFISIHNHPNNILPTGSDFVSCGSKKYAFGIVVCHDGSVYKYRHGSRPFRKERLDTKVDRINEIRYNGINIKNAQAEVLADFAKIYDIIFEELI